MTGGDLRRGGETAPPTAARGPRPGARRRLLTAAAVILPIAAYLALRAMLHSDAYALAVTETVPVIWILVDGWRRRRLNPLILAVAAVLGVALILTVASSGSALPLKLRRAVITGSLGIACLASLAGRRPLLPALLETLAESGPHRITALAGSLRARLPEHKAVGLTAIVGLTLIADAVAQIALALTVSTTMFVAIAGLVRLVVAIVGLGACAMYLRTARPAAVPSG